MCINLGPVNSYLTPSRAAQVVFENSEIYYIFGTASHSQLWLKIYEAPSSVHGV